MKNQVIASFFSEEATVTGNTSLAMMETNVGTIFQLDGEPLHFSHHERTSLDRHLPDKIGRGGPNPWPPHSPDLTPLDFFWGFVKDIAYCEKV